MNRWTSGLRRGSKVFFLFFLLILGLVYRILASGLGKIAHREPANISGLRILTIQGLLVITLVSIPAFTRLRRPQALHRKLCAI